MNVIASDPSTTRSLRTCPSPGSRIQTVDGGTPTTPSPTCWDTQPATAELPVPTALHVIQSSGDAALGVICGVPVRTGVDHTRLPVSGSRPTMLGAPAASCTPPTSRPSTTAPDRTAVASRASARHSTPIDGSAGGTTPGIAARAASRVASRWLIVSWPATSAPSSTTAVGSSHRAWRRSQPRAATTPSPGSAASSGSSSTTTSTRCPGRALRDAGGPAAAGAGRERAGSSTDSTSSTSCIRPGMSRTLRRAPPGDQASRRPDGVNAQRASASPERAATSSSGPSTRYRAAVVPSPTLTVRASSSRASNARSSVTSSPA